MQSQKQSPAWNPESSPSFWINHASRALMRLHDSRLRTFGFSMSQLQVLHALDEHGALPQKELARLLRVEQPSIAELLSRMERDGIVERRPNPDDKRGSLTSLTRASRTRLAKAKQALAEGAEEALSGITKKDRALIITLMQRVVQNVTAIGEERP